MKIKYDAEEKKTRYVGMREDGVPDWKHNQVTVVIRDNHEEKGHYLAWYYLGKIMITYLSLDDCIKTIKEMLEVEKNKASDDADEIASELIKMNGSLKEIMEHAMAD